MTYPQFDFYAQAVIERNGLRYDTLIMGQQMSLYNNVIRYKDGQLDNMNKILINKDSISNTYYNSYMDVAKKYNKLQKKNKRLKQTALVLSVVSCVLGIIIVIK
jgi:hypothetical protein